MTRREVLEQMFRALCVAGLTPMLVHCGSAAVPRKVDDPLGAAGILPATLQSILQSASSAPSLYNSQPWRILLLSPTSWHLGLDPDRLLPAADPNSEGALLALGAFLENLVVAAGAAGFEVDAEVPVGGLITRPDLIRIEMRKGGRKPYPMQRLRQRRVVKAGYLPRELSRQDAYLLETSGGSLSLTARGEQRASEIAGLIAEAASRSLRQDAWVEEFSEWVRFTEEEAGLRLDGLSRSSLEYETLKAWFWRRFSQPADLFSPTFREGRLGMIRELGSEGGGWLVIGSEGESVPEMLMAGRRIQRLFLQVRERGIAFHPMGEILAQPDLRPELMRSASIRYPRMLLRIGYVNAYPDPVSLRRPLSWFVQGGRGA